MFMLWQRFHSRRLDDETQYVHGNKAMSARLGERLCEKHRCRSARLRDNAMSPMIENDAMRKSVYIHLSIDPF